MEGNKNNLRIEDIDVDLFDPNPWNPNVMDESTFEHFLKEYKRVGYIQPILARPIKKRFQIIDGEHRWKIGKKSGMKKMTTVIVEMSDADAKITTINMNKIKGADDPLKLASLLKDLKITMDTAVLSQLININEAELAAIIDISTLPDLNSLDLSETEKLINCPHCGKEIDLKGIKLKKKGNKS